MTRTSGSRSMPVRCRTVARTCAMIASMSAALALPPGIDDEVRVLLRDARAADRVTLEAAASISRAAWSPVRIAEHAARIGQIERLRRDAPLRGARVMRARASARVARAESEPRRREDAVGRRSVAAPHASGSRSCTPSARARSKTPVARQHLDAHARSATSRRRSSRRSWRARRRPFPGCRPETPRRRSHASRRSARAWGSRPRRPRRSGRRRRRARRRGVHDDDRAAHAAVAHEHVAAEARAR